MLYLGCSFDVLYFQQKTSIRFEIKEALKKSEYLQVEVVNLIKTETSQDQKKIMGIIDNFDINIFNKHLVEVFNWGCGMLILNGHHRAIAAETMGFKEINIEMHRFSC